MVMRSYMIVKIVVISIFLLRDAQTTTDFVFDLKETARDGGDRQCFENHAESVDATSLMQGANVYVEYQSMKDPANAVTRPRQNKRAPAKFTHTLSFVGGYSDHLSRKTLDVSALLKQHTMARGSAILTLAILFLLMGTIVCVICICAKPRNRLADESAQLQGESAIGRWVGSQKPSPGRNVPWTLQSQSTVANDALVPNLRQDTRGILSASPGPSIRETRGNLQQQRILPSLPNTGASHSWKGPAVSQVSLQHAGGDRFHSPRGPQNLPPSPSSRDLPPPLCPTLVLPVCEARFGMPMQELARFTSEGDIGLVGLSGNTLLRASMKSQYGTRTLEISMPEPNSAPRATVGPAAPGARSLEIRAFRDSFYGTLEMRHNGACYVVRDGATVMVIDGNTDSLQLTISSSSKVELASVRVLTDAFGGADHVEVRVEPGVDTVLVLACVLAVLLLSPT